MQAKGLKGLHLLGLAFAALLFGWLFTPSQVYAKPPQAVLGVYQKLDYRDLAQSSTYSTFEYVLTAKDSAAPMPEGSHGSEYVFSLTGNIQKEIAINLPNTTKVYKYTLHQKKADLPKGYTQDDTVYNVEVYCVDGKVTILYKKGAYKEFDPGWTVTYQAPALPASPLARLTSKTGDILLAVIPAACTFALFGIGFILIGRRSRREAK